MCLSIAINRPDDILSRGEHAGFEWMVIYNGMGYRCGYVKLPPGHPWYGLDYDDIDEVEVHGGLTFAEADVDCGKDGPDNGWWLGFDCAHAWDARDPSLPMRGSLMPSPFCQLAEAFEMLFSFSHEETIKTTEYVENECRQLCEQAAAKASA